MTETTTELGLAVPASVATAVATIKRSVDAVAKNQHNSHGNYNYASTDNIYAAIARKMGEVGLMIVALEDLCEIKRFEQPVKERGHIVKDAEGKPVTQMVQWAHLVFRFVLATPEATWEHPKARRTLFIQVTGPQTFQAAQSFAEKAFIRNLFKIPTGDMDLDSLPQGDTEDDQIALMRNGRTPRKSSAEGKRDGSVKVFNEIRAKIADAPSSNILQQVRTLYAEEWATMPPRWAETLDDEYEVKMSGFGVNQAAE